MGGEDGKDKVGDNWAPSSPKNKVKFLCSYGGKILSRPIDGNLKYVGGETRVVAVPSDITFSDFMKKLTSLIDGDKVLKYQLATEDLDTLVSVRTDEDLKHMFHEYERYASGGTSMLRAFLFPFKPIVLENQLPVFEPHLMEQRYIEAINGIVHRSHGGRLSPVRVFRTSSACSSPKSSSPDGHTLDVVPESFPFNPPPPRSIMKPMHRVRSSPSISSPSNLQNSSGHGSHNMQHDPNYHRYQNRHHHAHGYPPLRMAQELQMGSGSGWLPPPTMSSGKAVMGGLDSINRFHQTNRHQRGGSGGSLMHHDEGSTPPYVHNRLPRGDSIARNSHDEGNTPYVHNRFNSGDSIPRNSGMTIWE